MKLLNDLADFTTVEIEDLLSLARRLETNPEPRALQGKVLALLFLNPSLRTLTSFQSAMTRLGGGVFVVSPEMSIHKIESRSGIIMDGEAAEHIREAIPVISSYSDAIGIRACARRENLEYDLSDNLFHEMTSLIDIPYINMESAVNHPCQSLADRKTLDDLRIPAQGGKFVLSWSWHPQSMPLAIPAATIHMAAQRGMDVTVLRPGGFELPRSIMAKAHAAAALSGGSVEETDDLAAMEGAQTIYVNSWMSQRHYGDSRAEEDFKHDLRSWCIDESWFENAASGCRFMHPLPVRREVTVTEHILNGPRSVVVAQARNRMLVQMAVLHRMLSEANGSDD